MSRTSRIKPVREYLEKARNMALKEQNAAVMTERFRDAEIYKSFKEVLIRAIELCGEGKKENG